MGMVNMISVALMRACSQKEVIWNDKVEGEFVGLTGLCDSWLRIVRISDWHRQLQEVVHGCRSGSGRVR